MTRAQLEAHLTLHGWFPAFDGEYNLVNYGRAVVWTRHESGASVLDTGTIRDPDGIWRRREVPWAYFPDDVFWRLVSYLRAKGWL